MSLVTKQWKWTKAWGFGLCLPNLMRSNRSFCRERKGFRTVERWMALINFVGLDKFLSKFWYFRLALLFVDYLEKASFIFFLLPHFMSRSMRVKECGVTQMSWVRKPFIFTLCDVKHLVPHLQCVSFTSTQLPPLWHSSNQMCGCLYFLHHNSVMPAALHRI